MKKQIKTIKQATSFKTGVKLLLLLIVLSTCKSKAQFTTPTNAQNTAATITSTRTASDVDV